MKLKDNVIMLDSAMGSNCFLIYDGQWVLIDTGNGFVGKRILGELDRLNIQPSEIRHILLTHHDSDHTGNLRLLKGATGATVWAHAEEIPFISGEKTGPGFRAIMGRLNATNRIPDVQPFGGDMHVGNIQVYHAPGHTPGHVCMRFEDVLFTGDLVSIKRGKAEPFTRLMNWDTEMLRASMEGLRGVEFKWVCPSHGRPVLLDRI